jgi:imidazolonepropionase-like amidohydrolase
VASAKGRSTGQAKETLICGGTTMKATKTGRFVRLFLVWLQVFGAIFICNQYGGVLAQAPAVSVPAARTLVRAGTLLDVKTGEEASGKTIVVVGDKVAAIAETASTPAMAGDTVIDLTKYTVMPGLIDVHTHLTMMTNFDPYWELSMTPGKEAIIGVENAKVTLEAGFTTVRNVGANDYTDVALRDEINAGRIPGPHMQVSGPPLGITGGHMDNNLLPFEYHVTAEGVADGIPAVQQKVRQNIKYGVDLIKIGASGGVLSKGDDPQASQYTQEELAAIVADAHRLGRKVAAHAHGAQAILWATNAGVDSIEHGSYIDDAGIAAMKAHGTYLVPTAYLVDWMREYGHLPEIYQQKMIDVGNAMKANHKRAIAAGVKVALGTDAAVYPHGLNAHELDVYVNQYGMTPLHAIQTGTINAADLMGWTDKVGSLTPGHWADVIAVQGDPLKDVKVLQDVKFVMKSGVVYKGQ